MYILISPTLLFNNYQMTVTYSKWRVFFFGQWNVSYFYSQHILQSKCRPSVSVLWVAFISTHVATAQSLTFFALYFRISILWQETNQQSLLLLLVEIIPLVMASVLLAHILIVHASRYELRYGIHVWPVNNNLFNTGYWQLWNMNHTLLPMRQYTVFIDYLGHTCMTFI